MTTIVRRATDAERAQIEHLHGLKSRWGNDIAGAACVGVVLIVLPGVILTRLTGFLRGQEHWYFLLAVVVGLAVMMQMRRPLARSRQATMMDVSADVREETFEVSTAIKVEEYQDLGSNYYLELSDGRVLFLSGQYLYEAEAEHRFPSRRVRTVRTGVANALLDFECSGEYMAPSVVLPAFSKERYRTGEVLADGEVLTIPFASLLPPA